PPASVSMPLLPPVGGGAAPPPPCPPAAGAGAPPAGSWLPPHPPHTRMAPSHTKGSRRMLNLLGEPPWRRRAASGPPPGPLVHWRGGGRKPRAAGAVLAAGGSSQAPRAAHARPCRRPRSVAQPPQQPGPERLLPGPFERGEVARRRSDALE